MDIVQLHKNLAQNVVFARRPTVDNRHIKQLDSQLPRAHQGLLYRRGGTILRTWCIL